MIDNFYICNRKKSVDHCIETCFHGKPHEKDECTKIEFCDAIKDNVKCRKLKIKEKKLLKG